jgi:predicted RecB family endonuclease
MVLEFRDKLRNCIDEAFTKILVEGKSYDAGLDTATDIVEEVLAEELARLMTQVVLMMTNDLSNLEKAMLREVDELIERKKFREKMAAEAEHLADQVAAKEKKTSKRRK